MTTKAIGTSIALALLATGVPDLVPAAPANCSPACQEGQKCIVDQCVWGCANIPKKGCCYGEYVVRCDLDGKTPKYGTCSVGLCGWADGIYYACATDGSPDPSGTYPKDCDFSCTPKCQGRVCGDDQCGGTCGSCEPGEVCLATKCCKPACDGRECGPDVCEGACGPGCAEGFWCTESGKCTYGFGCEQTAYPGCGGCACEKCVCDQDSYCCTEKWDWKCTHTCQHECGGCLPCQGDECSPLPDSSGPPEVVEGPDPVEETEAVELVEAVEESGADPGDAASADQLAASEDQAAASEFDTGIVAPDATGEGGGADERSGGSGGCRAGSPGRGAGGWNAAAVAAMCLLVLGALRRRPA